MRRRSYPNPLLIIPEYAELRTQHPAETVKSPPSSQVSFGGVDAEEYDPSSPAESPKRQISSASLPESPTSPLSPNSQEVEKRLEEAKRHAKENARNKEIIDRLGLITGKKKEDGIGSATLGELSGNLQDPSANPLFRRRRSQSK